MLSIQYHSKASSGPQDTINSFERFVEMVGVKNMTSVVDKEKLIEELKEFDEGLDKFKKLVDSRGLFTASSTKEEIINLCKKLIRTSGRLRKVIAPPAGKLSMKKGEFKFDAFVEAFNIPPYMSILPTMWVASIDNLILKTNFAIAKLEPAISSKQIPQEAVFPSGKPYDAFKTIMDIFRGATKKLIVVDPYVDQTLFDMFEHIAPKIHIQILTQNMGGEFKLAGQKFKEQREEAQQGKLEIRKSGKLHDRFIVADQKIFHIGASLKDAGTKMCAMSEFEGSDIKTTLRKIISGYWDKAEIVI